MRKKALGLFLILLFLCFDGYVETEMWAATKQSEAKQLARIERNIKAWLVKKGGDKFLLISSAKNDKASFQIWIELQFNPTTLQQVRARTDAICEIFYHELKKVGIKKNISVWAKRAHSGGLVKVYGRTFYSHVTGRFKFERAK